MTELELQSLQSKADAEKNELALEVLAHLKKYLVYNQELQSLDNLQQIAIKSLQAEIARLRESCYLLEKSKISLQ